MSATFDSSGGLVPFLFEDGVGLRTSVAESGSTPTAKSDSQKKSEGRERRELLCEDCDREYTIWYADNDLWNAVMRCEGSAYANDQPEPFLCSTCFLIRAEPVTEFARVTWPEHPSRRDREAKAVAALADAAKPSPRQVDRESSWDEP